MKTIIVNCKNYPEVLGEGTLRMALAVARVAAAVKVNAIVAPPAPMLAQVASKSKAKVFSQGVASAAGDRTTGAVLPEAVKAAGAVGTILNHSESRVPAAELTKLVPRLAALGLEVCLCARTSKEAAKLSKLSPAYIAVEPPELIGSGVAVSRARPELIERTVAALREAGYGGEVLCGAGIVSGDDVRKAVELGSDGVLVASSVVKAPDWEIKIRELAGSLL